MLFRCRPSEIAAWPAWEVRLIEEFLSLQPAPEERLELAVAQLHATYIDAHQKPGTPPIQLSRLLPYRDPWSRSGGSRRYSDVDLQMLDAFGDL